MVYVLLGTGFEETEAIVPVDLLRRAGIPVQTVSLADSVVFGAHGIGISADISVAEMDLTALEMLVLPGGLGGVASIKACPAAMDAITFAYHNKKWIGAICAAPTILASLGITDGHRVVCYPGCESQMGNAQVLCHPAVTDGSLITGASAGCAVEFALALIRGLKGTESADNVAKQIVIR